MKKREEYMKQKITEQNKILEKEINLNRKSEAGDNNVTKK
jgi:hypothetical protein